MNESTETIWLITGEPGAGKSTAVSKILLKVKSEGFTVGGILTREVRSHGEREGFRLIDVSTEESGTLASITGVSGPRVGKYRIDLKTLSALGVKALRHGAEKSDLIVCDEVGPMELASPEFRAAISECFFSHDDKPAICVIHKRLVDPVIEKLKSSSRAKIVEVDYENRNDVANDVARDVLSSLKKIDRDK
jgi:nucleoside-triphosphatase